MSEIHTPDDLIEARKMHLAAAKPGNGSHFVVYLIDRIASAEAQNNPGEYQQQCPLCKGTGEVESTGFANAVEMDAGGEPRIILRSCRLCKGKKTILTLDAEEAVQLLTRTEHKLRNLKSFCQQVVEERDRLLSEMDTTNAGLREIIAGLKSLKEKEVMIRKIYEAQK